MQATKQQKQLIHINAPSREIKEMLVSEITGDPEKYSCNDLSFEQANDILRHLGLNPHRKKRRAYDPWRSFKKRNPQHKYILSLCIQAGWSVPSERYGEIADMDRLGSFLQSPKSPVKKPLNKQNDLELSKTIIALEGIVKHSWK